MNEFSCYRGVNACRHIMSEDLQVYYLQQIAQDLNNQVFKCPWGGVIIKNEEDGKLISFKSKEDYRRKSKKLWLHLSLKVFRHNGAVHTVFCCDECDIMKGVDKLKLDSSREDVQNLLCLHSKTASFLIQNWREIWNIEVPRFVTAYQPNLNQEISLHRFQARTKDTTLLAGVWVDGGPHLVVTVTKRQSTPFCSTCDSLTCGHYKAYISRNKDKNLPVSNFNSSMANNPLNDAENADNPGEIDDVEVHTVEEVIDPAVGEEETEFRHYLDLPPPPEYNKMYGYNRSKVLFPFERSKEQQETWIKRINHVYDDFPESFVPIWSIDKTCSHGVNFDPSDESMTLESETILVYNIIGEQVFQVKNYARKSLHSCKELLRIDGHRYLLWNIGGGRYVNYTILNQYLHLWKNYGLSIGAMHKSIVEASSVGISSTLTYNDLHRAITGFFVCLSFDEKTAFSCPKHGSSPVWINTDGKCTGPAMRRVKHIEELDIHKEDTQVLKQSTKLKDRVFLTEISERSQVSELVTGKISSEEFLTGNMTTENGVMVMDLVNYLADEWPEEIPKPYLKLLSNISKATSVRGLLQVSNNEPLEYLKDYCNETVNIRDVEHLQKLKIVMSELPAFWPILDSICLLENRTFLPELVSRIVLRILTVRQTMFDRAVHRDETDYIDWNGREHATMCYPNLKLFRYPKKVKVNSKIDKDLCEKNFHSNSDFTAGIFSVGCACEYNTTLGMYFF